MLSFDYRLGEDSSPLVVHRRSYCGAVDMAQGAAGLAEEVAAHPDDCPACQERRALMEEAKKRRVITFGRCVPGGGFEAVDALPSVPAARIERVIHLVWETVERAILYGGLKRPVVIQARPVDGEPWRVRVSVMPPIAAAA